MSAPEQLARDKNNSTTFAFNSDNGRALISTIIQQYAPYVPHDYLLEGLGEVLEGKDLFAITPTGSGKTGYMAFTALIVRELTTSPERYPEVGKAAKKFPKNPLMLSICPTNYLEYQLVSKFQLAMIHNYNVNTFRKRKCLSLA